MKNGFVVTTTRRGTSVRATGSAAQALFDALTKSRTEPQPAPATTAPSEAEQRVQIGPLDC